MTQANEDAFKSMQCVMKNCVETPNCGLLLAPTGVWTGSEELVIKGMSDTIYASDYDMQQSVMGRTTLLRGKRGCDTREQAKNGITLQACWCCICRCACL
jgi:hypothetical protein